ncbi:MAG: prolipoprotein diacylglyceryl transferase, partial [Oscillospiraceae bacterium]|nr:prolipoprotein diacylglyceryl transferase [Oscillospiraceae bacterium]
MGLLIFCKWKKVKVGAIADVGGLGLLIGQAIGRWGNFINREAYGVKT